MLSYFHLDFEHVIADFKKGGGDIINSTKKDSQFCFVLLSYIYYNFVGSQLSHTRFQLSKYQKKHCNTWSFLKHHIACPIWKWFGPSFLSFNGGKSKCQFDFWPFLHDHNLNFRSSNEEFKSTYNICISRPCNNLQIDQFEQVFLLHFCPKDSNIIRFQFSKSKNHLKTLGIIFLNLQKCVWILKTFFWLVPLPMLDS